MPFDRRLQTFGHVRSIDEATRRVSVVVSTGNLARDNAIIEQRGWRFDNYDRNPVVLWCHDDQSLPIARALPAERQVSDNELVETHEFATHAKAEEVWQAVVGGFVHATSVRWLPGATEVRKVEGRNVIVFTDGHELLESSYVPIPADPSCLVMRADGRPLPLLERAGRPMSQGNLDKMHSALEEFTAAHDAVCDMDDDCPTRSADTAQSRSRMVIDYAWGCGVRGCERTDERGSMDLCDFHFEMAMSGELPMPPSDEDEMAHAATTDSLPARLAAFAAQVRETNEMLKGA